jgi:hypothetical protein
LAVAGCRTLLLSNNVGHTGAGVVLPASDVITQQMQRHSAADINNVVRSLAAAQVLHVCCCWETMVAGYTA